MIQISTKYVIIWFYFVFYNINMKIDECNEKFEKPHAHHIFFKYIIITPPKKSLVTHLKVYIIYV